MGTEPRGNVWMSTAPIVSRVWSFCTTLRDNGVSYGDYLERLTYLIFLKMADEYGKPPYSRDVRIPAAYEWQSLKTKRGAELEAHYVTLLRELGTRRGMLGQIFTKAQNKIQDPAKLYRLIDMVDDTDWVTLGADVKGDIYEGETIRRKLLDTTDLHSILRLPTGVFYAQGVKANVIFFDNREASPDPWTKRVWYYDYRTNIHHTLKKKPMRFGDLADFIKCYNPQNRHERTRTWDENTGPEGRWQSYPYEEIITRDKTSLDIFWLKDKSLTDLDDLPEPEDLAAEIIENLEAGLESFRTVLDGLGSRG